MDQAINEARGDARPQHDHVQRGGHGRQSSGDSHSNSQRWHDPTATGTGALPQHNGHVSHTQPKQHHSSHRQPPPSKNLDPTGMFRNRGRRVIAGSRGTPVQNGTIPSPSPSPTKNHQHPSRIYHDYPLVRSEEFNSNAQQQHLHAQHNFRTSYDHASSKSSAKITRELTGAVAVSSATKSQQSQALLVTEEQMTKPQDNVNHNFETNSDSPERIKKEEEPEQDHPPQSFTRGPINSSNSGGGKNVEKVETGENLIATHSNDSIDSDQDHSTVGSTISIMGSIVGEGDYSSSVDEARLLVVKRRMMQDVAEVLEEEEEEDEEKDDDGDNSESGSKNVSKIRELEETVDSDTVYDNTLNVSLECNADTDTSLLDDDPICDITPQDREGNDEEERYRNTPNLVKVADFSNVNNADINVNTINKGNEPNDEQSTKKEQESPFRAAFRRSAQGMSSHLPPLSTQMLLTPNKFHRVTASTAIDKAATTASFLPQLARQCFSFEDTTLDDDDFLVMPGQLSGEGGQTASHKYYGLAAVASFAGDNANSSTAKIDETKSIHSAELKRIAPTTKWHPPPRTRLMHGESTSPFRVIRQSQTWDHHHGRPSMRQNQTSHQKNQVYLRQTSSFDPWSPSSVGGQSSQRVWSNRDGLSSNIDEAGKTCPKMGSSGSMIEGNQDTEKKDWKKIETERGDAIDLLACMVEQSLKFGQAESENSHAFLCGKCHERRDKESSHQFICNDCIEKVKCVAYSLREDAKPSIDEQSSEFDSRIRSNVIDALLNSYEFSLVAKQSALSANKWLKSIGKETDIVSDKSEDCNKPLDSVALKARLHSAESVISSKQGDITRLNEELSKCKAEIGRLKSSQHQAISTNKSILSNSSSDESLGNADEESNSLVLCSPRPTVKLAESNDESFQKWEKNIERQMNLECRKEILLLKAHLEKAHRKLGLLEGQQQEPFKSDIEPIKSSDDGEEELFMKIAEDIEKEALDTPVSDMNEEMSSIPDIIKLNDPALEKELEEYRKALIMSLDAEGNGRHSRADSITSSEDPNLGQDVSKSNSSEYADRKMINVRMLNGENFSTEWGDLVELHPPPDHSLNSPIVDAILTKWTDDPDTRRALVEWIESILDGSGVDSVPSLKLCGLDHQVRDGFVMHLLPLLLRRKDIQVNLTSRAHRVTTYDIAVSVTPTTLMNNSEHDRLSDIGSEDLDLQQRQMRENKHHMMAFQATKSGASVNENNDAPISPDKRFPTLAKPFLDPSIPGLVRSASNAGSISTAITSPISNRTPSRMPHGRNRYTSLSSEMKKGHNSRGEYEPPNTLMSIASPSLGDDLSVGSSVEDDADSKHSQRQSSIMGSISGAFGLLSRRKSPVENELQAAPNTIFQTPKREARINSNSSNEKEHPYHRVVSAPPGKIGITFVEYRGHAVVSNVSEDSPLVGWVFPSDVLIAIDDVPVSGLRTRDIVKLLTTRIGQQRDLRMVSAVSMNELTRPGTV